MSDSMVVNYNNSFDLKLNVEIKEDENISEEDLLFSKAFLDGAFFHYIGVYQGSSDGFLTISAITDRDNISEETDDCFIALISDVSPTSLIGLKKKEAEIQFTLKNTEMINTIPVVVTPIVNGKEILDQNNSENGETSDNETIPVMLPVDSTAWKTLKHLKTKKTNLTSIIRTKDFIVNVNESDPEKATETKKVHYEVFAIRNPNNVLETDFNNYLGIDVILYEGENRYVFVKTDNSPDISGQYISPRFFITQEALKCFNMYGNIDVSDPSQPSFSYIQLRLFDENGNDLSQDSNNYYFNYEDNSGVKYVFAEFKTQ